MAGREVTRDRIGGTATSVMYPSACLAPAYLLVALSELGSGKLGTNVLER